MMLEYVDRVAQRFGYVRIDPDVQRADRVRQALESTNANAVLDEVQLAIARNSDPLMQAESDAELAKHLWQLFEGAVDKLERDRRDAQLYAGAPEQDRDPDPSFRDGATRASASDWK
jgi:hypothetical protein